MRLLFLSPYMTFGGAEKFLFDLGGYLLGRGHTVALVSSGGVFADGLAELGARTYRLPLERRSAFAANAWALRGVLKREAPQLVCANSFLTAALARLAGARPLLILHNPLQAWHLPVIARAGRLLVERVLSVTDCNRRRLVALGFPAGRIETVPNGVDLTRFPAREWRPLREEVRVGTVARLEGYKGHRFLLRALAELCAGDRPVVLELVGDGAARPELEALAQSLGLASRVHFLGSRADVARIVAGWDIFVLPSLVEGLPISILEAMAVGVPVVATDVGGVAEVVRDGVTGLLVPAGDSRALAGAIGRLIDEEGLARRLTLAARRQIEERFASGVVMAQFEQALLAAAHG